MIKKDDYDAKELQRFTIKVGIAAAIIIIAFTAYLFYLNK